MPSETPLISIVLCTCNRADHLRQTLKAMAAVCVPANWRVELLVVDNASTDATPQLVRECGLPAMEVRYVSEPRRGKGYAYNTGIAQAQGEILLFTDDDVRPPADWIFRMCAPLLADEADAVAGGICIAPHLLLPWMTDAHREWMACTDTLPADSQIMLIGANMAFARRVLEKVPGFDWELGPGALGHADDTLFSFQLEAAQFRILTRLDIAVEHHFDAGRLTRAGYARQAEKRGEFNAYVAYHWRQVPFVPWRLCLRLQKCRVRLLAARLRHWREWRAHPSMPEWEMRLLEDVHTIRRWLIERKRPRNYAPQGLVRRDWAKS